MPKTRRIFLKKRKPTATSLYKLILQTKIATYKAGRQLGYILFVMLRHDWFDKHAFAGAKKALICCQIQIQIGQH